MSNRGYVIGIDQSLSKTGICFLGGPEKIQLMEVKSKPLKAEVDFPSNNRSLKANALRIRASKQATDIANSIMAIAPADGKIRSERPHIGIEQITFSKMRDGLVLLYHYLIEKLLWEGYHVFIVVPQEAKEFATGESGARKTEMVDAANRVFPELKLKYKEDDLADAIAIASVVEWMKTPTPKRKWGSSIEVRDRIALAVRDNIVAKAGKGKKKKNTATG